MMITIQKNKQYTYTAALWLAFASGLCVASASLHAQTTPTKAITAPECQVKDPEIKGRYVGQCNGVGLAHGSGVAQGQQAEYSGQFINGEKHGHGVKVWRATGDRYVGEFKQDYRDGFGLYAWGELTPLKGYQYLGQFKQDKRDGQGIFNWPNGESYAGRWQADAQMDGFTPTQILQGQEADARSGLQFKRPPMPSKP
jgi:hypothetical protein